MLGAAVSRRRPLRVLASLVAVGFAGYVVAKSWEAAAEALRQMSLLAVAAAVLVAAGSVLVSAQAWRAAVRAQGAALPRTEATAVFAATQLGKYVPGSVWGVVAQVDALRRRGLPASAPAVAFVTTMGAVVVTGVGLGVPAMLAIWPTWLALVAGVAVVGVAALALAAPEPARRGLGGLFRRVHARLPVVELGRSHVLAVGGWTLAGWLVLLAAVAVLELAAGAGATAAALGASAFALAWVAGFVVPLLPGGLGLREGVFVVLATPILGAGVATAVALLARLVMVAADCLVGGVALLVRPTPAGPRSSAQAPKGSGESVEG